LFSGIIIFVANYRFFSGAFSEASLVVMFSEKDALLLPFCSVHAVPIRASVQMIWVIFAMAASCTAWPSFGMNLGIKLHSLTLFRP
tara:strand:+ start:584 stop:841 length:258 start_codon:yes stop_codon:yes gene_type:complete